MFCVVLFFFLKQKTAYEMRISDWRSDVCSSDLVLLADVRLNDADAGGSALRDGRAGESCNAHEQREDERQRGGSFAVGTACGQKEEAGDQDRQSRKAISADPARAVG